MLEFILGLSAVTLAIAAFIWFLPILLIARSNKTSGGEKLVWILLVIFFSWFTWILYALVAPLAPPEGQA
ncbi:MAG: hypothetical protein P8Z31_02370 [Gammaproteobacteria bacterium]|jgi:hypothetical protein